MSEKVVKTLQELTERLEHAEENEVIQIALQPGEAAELITFVRTKVAELDLAHGKPFEILAHLSAHVGTVKRGTDQPVLIKTTDLDVSEINEMMEELNQSISEGVPLLGSRRNPQPMRKVDVQSLRQLGDVIAARTIEKVQLNPFYKKR